METRKFSKFDIANIKRTAQMVNPMVTKKTKIAKQIVKLQEEFNQFNTMQEQYEASIKTLTGGFGTEDLLDKVSKVVGQDKNGKDIKVTNYVLKYPETIIPVVEDNVESTSDCSVESNNFQYKEDVTDEELANIALTEYLNN